MNPASDRVGPVLAWGFLLALLVGTLGYDFINYTLPPDKLISSGADLSAAAIFRQSLFMNTQRGFVDSPFVFLMIAVSWASGVLVVLSEMIRQEEIVFSPLNMAQLNSSRHRTALLGFLLLGILSLAQRFLGQTPLGPTEALLRSLMLIWAVACLFAAWSLARGMERGRLIGVLVASAGIAISPVVLLLGSTTVGIGLAIVCSILLFLLWDRNLRPIVLPSLIVAVISLVLGMAFTYFQAVLLREALLYLIFFQGIEPISSLFTLYFRPDSPVTSIEQARVIESMQAMRFLTAYFVYLFAMIGFSGFFLVRRSIRLAKSWGRIPAYAAAALSLIVAMYLISGTNMRPVQADMVFKRGRPFDEQAVQLGDPEMWKVAVAIYEESLDLMPFEDYYYLFLGRGYLEQSASSADSAERLALLREAEQRLIEARSLNPLNTDHSANLARLNTRWAVTSGDPDVQMERLDQAERYYQEALQLSPQNSVVRNELARFAYDLKRDCDQSIALYEESRQIDPFYTETYFGFADVLTACAEAQSDVSRSKDLFQAAIENLDAGLSQDPGRVRAWLQAGQINQRLTRFNDALQAFAKARELSTETALPTWNIDFLEADVYREMGDTAAARALAEQALVSAPDNIALQIESFLATLE